MISTETYNEMKRLISEFENANSNSNKGELPYLFEYTVEVERKYNPKFGDEKVCKCGHEYYRHFDTYESMSDVGCKYCGCGNFEEA